MGSVVISIEVSLGWANRPGGGDVSSERCRTARHAWRRVGYLLDRYAIPATWFVAGHLFVPTCKGVHVDHPLDPSDLPCKASADGRRHCWTAPELVGSVRDSRVDHEIGCQPFTRIDFGAEETTQELAAAEVRASIDAAAELGIEPDELRSFSFPGDRAGHHDVLAAYGFQCYRDRPVEWHRTGPLSGLVTLASVLSSGVVGSNPPFVSPTSDEHGLVVVPTSLPLFPLERRGRSLARSGSRDPVASTVVRGVEAVTEDDGILHLSFRPLDFRTEADFERLEDVLTCVADRRREGELVVETVGRAARRLGDHAATPPTAAR